MGAQDAFVRRVRELTSRRRHDPRPSQKDVAKALKVEPSAVNNWLRGIREISLNDAARVAKFLDSSLGQLVDDSAIEMTPDEIRFLYFVRRLSLDGQGLDRIKRTLAAMYDAPANTVIESASNRAAPARRRRHGS